MPKALLAAGVLALSMAAPALGETGPTGRVPDEDLRCAAWAAVGAGIYQDDPQIGPGFAVALAWFIARYEGATGKPFEEAMTPEFLDSLQPELQAIQDVCKPRVQEMSDRLTNWAAALRNSDQ